MLNNGKGAIPLFKAFDIQVSLHWSWFLVAYWQISSNSQAFDNWIWMVAVYLTIFAIILTHEFGHSLACRSTGGRSEDIILWPFGGIAFVQPPQRPGAVLWSLAAGPLVNVVLLPVFFLLKWALTNNVFGQSSRDVIEFAEWISFTNLWLLIFNMLPIYPLDGGQILRALLWYPLGQVQSLFIATIIGLFGGVGLAAWAAHRRSFWMIGISIFLMSICWKSFRQALAWRKADATRQTEPPPVLDI